MIVQESTSQIGVLVFDTCTQFKSYSTKPIGENRLLKNSPTEKQADGRWLMRKTLKTFDIFYCEIHATCYKYHKL